MKLNVVLGAAVVAGAMTGAGSSWAGDAAATPPAAKAQPAPASAKDTTATAKADKADAKADKADAKATAKPDKAAAKADAKADKAADRADAKADKVDVAIAAAKPEGAEAVAAVPGAEVSKEALASRASARDAYQKLWAERRAAREAAMAGKTAEEAEKAAREIDSKFADRIRDSRAKLWTAQRAAFDKPLTTEQIAAREQRLAKLTEKAHADREKHRKAYLSALEKSRGKQLTSPAVTNELRRHAWRIARLERLLTIAEASERTDLVKQITELREREGKRHDALLDQLAKEQAASPAPIDKVAQPAADKAAAAEAATPPKAAPATGAATPAPKGAAQ